MLEKEKLVNISKKTFINVIIILFLLMVLTIILTYLLPKGEYVTSGDETIFQKSADQSGINIFVGLFSPFLLLFHQGGIAIVFLIIFLATVSGSFQVMNDTRGIEAIVTRLIKRFANHKKVLIAIIILVFMLFGSLFGLFEETLSLLPIIIIFCISLGYDSYLAFLICTVATGFGFSCAITNPFTILVASQQAGADMMSGIVFRIITFLIMYLLLLGFALLHVRKLERNTNKVDADEALAKFNVTSEPLSEKVEKRLFRTYTIYLLLIVVTIILSTSIVFLRDYTVLLLIVLFLFGGFIAGLRVGYQFKEVGKAFLKGAVATLPAAIMILMATSIRYILEMGMIQDSIAYLLEGYLKPKSYLTLVAVLFIVLFLEFFISSSTAKASIIVAVLKGVLVVRLGYTSELLVLIYTYGDGFTNVIFPTSPVLLIALAMCGISYGKWVKRSWVLMGITLALVLGFIYIAYIIGY